MFLSGEFPTSWSKIVIITLYKKADINVPGNYRGIALLDICSKVYTSILTRRITFYVNINDKIREEQGGFRYGYSTT